jgi:hypothetical protein
MSSTPEHLSTDPNQPFFMRWFPAQEESLKRALMNKDRKQKKKIEQTLRRERNNIVNENINREFKENRKVLVDLMNDELRGRNEILRQKRELFKHTRFIRMHETFQLLNQTPEQVDWKLFQQNFKEADRILYKNLEKIYTDIPTHESIKSKYLEKFNEVRAEKDRKHKEYSIFVENERQVLRADEEAIRFQESEEKKLRRAAEKAKNAEQDAEYRAAVEARKAEKAAKKLKQQEKRWAEFNKMQNTPLDQINNDNFKIVNDQYAKDLNEQLGIQESIKTPEAIDEGIEMFMEQDSEKQEEMLKRMHQQLRDDNTLDEIDEYNRSYEFDLIPSVEEQERMLDELI